MSNRKYKYASLMQAVRDTMFKYHKDSVLEDIRDKTQHLVAKSSDEVHEPLIKRTLLGILGFIALGKMYQAGEKIGQVISVVSRNPMIIGGTAIAAATLAKLIAAKNLSKKYIVAESTM